VALEISMALVAVGYLKGSGTLTGLQAVIGRKEEGRLMDHPRDIRGTAAADLPIYVVLSGTWIAVGWQRAPKREGKGAGKKTSPKSQEI
jgi:hypothetical protein